MSEVETVWLYSGTPIGAQIENLERAKDVVKQYGKSVDGNWLWKLATDIIWPVDQEYEDPDDYYHSLRDIILGLRGLGESPQGSYSFSHVNGMAGVSTVGGIVVNEELVKIVEMDREGEVRTLIYQFGQPNQ
jgi:hypothetical protein